MGANVIAVSRNAAHLEALRGDCDRLVGGKLITLQLDLADTWDVVKSSLQAKVKVPLDGLVNNAGVAHIKPFEEITEQDFDSTFNVNIKAVFNVTQSLLPKMNIGANIVNVSSLASTRSFAGHSAYSATKAAVDSLTKSLALELGPRKIRVNSVNPTVILTKMGLDNWSDPKKADPLLNHIPLHRFGEVDEVVKAITYLLGDESSYVNGHQLYLEGGYSVQ